MGTMAIDQLLDSDRLVMTGLLRARISQVMNNLNFMALRRLVTLAADDAEDFNGFLREVLASYNDENFHWGMVDDALAAKMHRTLLAYLDIYQKLAPMQASAIWWVSRLSGLPKLARLAKENIGMIGEIILLLDEDREDVLAAHAALQAGGKTHSLDEIMQDLGMTA